MIEREKYPRVLHTQCHDCDGLGHKHVPRAAVGGTAVIPEPCPSCNKWGAGKTPGRLKGFQAPV